MVGQGHLPDPGRAGATSDHRCERRGVVRRDERRHPDQLARTQRPRHRVHRCHLERGSLVQQREQAGQPLGEHGLADPGRARHGDVVPARGGQLEGGPRRQLSAHVAQVRSGGRRAAEGAGSGVELRRQLHVRRRVAAQLGDEAGQGVEPGDVEVGNELGLAQVPAGTTRAPTPASRAASAATSAPRTGRIRPSRPSSPTKTSVGDRVGREGP